MSTHHFTEEKSRTQNLKLSSQGWNPQGSELGFEPWYLCVPWTSKPCYLLCKPGRPLGGGLSIKHKHSLVAEGRLHHCLGACNKEEHMSWKMSPEKLSPWGRSGCIFSPENSLLRGVCSQCLLFSGFCSKCGLWKPNRPTEYLAHYLVWGRLIDFSFLFPVSWE